MPLCKYAKLKHKAALNIISKHSNLNIVGPDFSALCFEVQRATQAVFELLFLFVCFLCFLYSLLLCFGFSGNEQTCEHVLLDMGQPSLLPERSLADSTHCGRVLSANPLVTPCTLPTDGFCSPFARGLAEILRTVLLLVARICIFSGIFD